MMVDLIVAVAMVFGVLKGLRRGFLLSLFSFGGLLAGLAAGWSFAPGLVEFLDGRYGWLNSLAIYLSEHVLLPGGVSSLFSDSITHTQLAEILLTVVAFLVIYGIVRGVIEGVGESLRGPRGWGVVGAVDRMLGAIFGLLATVLALAVVFGFVIAVSPAIPALGPVAGMIENSASAHGLARLFFLMGPLKDLVTGSVPSLEVMRDGFAVLVERRLAE